MRDARRLQGSRLDFFSSSRLAYGCASGVCGFHYLVHTEVGTGDGDAAKCLQGGVTAPSGENPCQYLSLSSSFAPRDGKGDRVA